MSYQMYKYFKPNTVAVFNKPVTLVKPVDKLASEEVETLQVQKACLDRNQRQQNIYYKKYNVQQYKKKNWDEFNRVDAKL